MKKILAVLVLALVGVGLIAPSAQAATPAACTQTVKTYFDYDIAYDIPWHGPHLVAYYVKSATVTITDCPGTHHDSVSVVYGDRFIMWRSPELVLRTCFVFTRTYGVTRTRERVVGDTIYTGTQVRPTTDVVLDCTGTKNDMLLSSSHGHWSRMHWEISHHH